MMNDPIESASVSRPFFAAPRLVTGIVLIAALLVSIAAVLAILKLNKNDPISTDEFAEMLGWRLFERTVECPAGGKICIGWRDETGARQPAHAVWGPFPQQKVLRFKLGFSSEGTRVHFAAIFRDPPTVLEWWNQFWGISPIVRISKTCFRTDFDLPFTPTATGDATNGIGFNGFRYEPKPPASGEYWIISAASDEEQRGADLGFWIEP